MRSRWRTWRESEAAGGIGGITERSEGYERGEARDEAPTKLCGGAAAGGAGAEEPGGRWCGRRRRTRGSSWSGSG
jgi:hypothetical protein